MTNDLMPDGAVDVSASGYPERVQPLRDVEKRLAEATGPDRDIDTALMEIAGYTCDIIRDGIIGPEIIWRKRGITTGSPGRFTSSIDAALTLVPDGWFWFCGHLDQTDRRFAATVEERAVVGAPYSRGVAPTAALAICLAAIRTRIAHLGTTGDATP